MKYIVKGPFDLPRIELTRRNLLALLAKLDGNPPNSACTLIDPDYKIMVKAVEDEEHYADREPGPLHDDTMHYMDCGIAGGWPHPASAHEKKS